MKRNLILFVVALIVSAALPAMAADKDFQEPSLCIADEGAELYGMTVDPTFEKPLEPKEICWFETRWVSDGCCTKSWGLAYKQKQQERMCCQYSGCRSWYNTGSTNCTNYPC